MRARLLKICSGLKTHLFMRHGRNPRYFRLVLPSVSSTRILHRSASNSVASGGSGRRGGLLVDLGGHQGLPWPWETIAGHEQTRSAYLRAGRQLRHRSDDIIALRKATIEMPAARIGPPRYYNGVHDTRRNRKFARARVAH